MLKLDIGCGGRGTMYEGFVGIDTHKQPEQLRNEKAAGHLWETDAVLDPLPFELNTVDEIVCFHVLEHLDGKRKSKEWNAQEAQVFPDGYHEGAALIKRMHGLLKPGASAYISAPDNDLFAQKYLAANRGNKAAQLWWRRTYTSGKDMWPGETPLIRFVNQMRDHKKPKDYKPHYTPYDFLTLEYVAVKLAGIPRHCISELPKDHKWSKRPDHETGIIITK